MDMKVMAGQTDGYEGHGRTDRLTQGLGRMCILCYHPKRSLEGVVYLNNCDKSFNSQEDLIQWLFIY